MIHLQSTSNVALSGVKVGDRFGRLIVEQLHTPARHGKSKIWLLRCDCGNTTTVASGTLNFGATKSCGCLQKEKSRERFTQHGHNTGEKRSATYHSWVAMKNRCYNSKQKDWNNYGGRGIIVCDRWKNSFKNFLADMGPRPAGMTIDRINCNGNYEWFNCRWLPRNKQSSNRRKWK